VAFGPGYEWVRLGNTMGIPTGQFHRVDGAQYLRLGWRCSYDKVVDDRTGHPAWMRIW
jgi:hypothetical protein